VPRDVTTYRSTVAAEAKAHGREMPGPLPGSVGSKRPQNRAFSDRRPDE
jgi:hypothetical protein